MCKALIEEAAKDEIPSRAMVVNGVYNADWNEATKILTLVYNPRLVTSEEVQRKIAEAGYDTEKFKADDRAYAKLPECCKYNRKK